MRLQWDYNENTMRLQWDYHEITERLPWDYYEITIMESMKINHISLVNLSPSGRIWKWIPENDTNPIDTMQSIKINFTQRHILVLKSWMKNFQGDGLQGTRTTKSPNFQNTERAEKLNQRKLFVILYYMFLDK